MSHSDNDIRCNKCKHPLKHARFYQGMAYGPVCVKKIAEKKNAAQKLFIDENNECENIVFKDEKLIQKWEDYKAKYGLVEII